MDAIILSIGSELTRGLAVDTNSAWLSGQLLEIGVGVRAHVTLSDEQRDISEAIIRAARQVSVVLISGGIGPTKDDLTRHALADAMGVELLEDAASWERLQAYYSQRSYPLTSSNRRQILFPKGSKIIPNSCGTAPGIRAELHGARVFCMPSVPNEMKAMFARDVIPELGASPGGQSFAVGTLLTFGKGESAIGEILSDMMHRGRNPQVGTQAGESVIGIRVCARAEDAGQAREMLDRDLKEIRSRLGDVVFGTEPQTLAGAVGEILAARRKTLAVAESCTGGMLAGLLTDVPGSSAYFLEGLVTYANEAKTRLLGVPAELIESGGAVSAPVAEAMSAACRSRSGADYALSTTGVAGPSGGTPDKPIGLVYVAIADDAGTKVRELRLGPQLDRHQVRLRACRCALNLLRHRLLRGAG